MNRKYVIGVGGVCLVGLSIAIFVACTTTPSKRPSIEHPRTELLNTGSVKKDTDTKLPPKQIISFKAEALGQAPYTSYPGLNAKVVLAAIPFSELPGWQSDDLSKAWGAWQANCSALVSKPVNKPEIKSYWQGACERSRAYTPDEARQFFETEFQAYRLNFKEGAVFTQTGLQKDLPQVTTTATTISNKTNTKPIDKITAGNDLAKPAESGLITGYYEPLLRGSYVKTAKYQYPLFKVPEDLIKVPSGPTSTNKRQRARLENGKLLPYYNSQEFLKRPNVDQYALVYVDDALDAQFLQIQGSGRVQICPETLMPQSSASAQSINDHVSQTSAENCEIVRLQYADQNGHPYKPIGRTLVERGELTREQVSMQTIRAWGAAHPEQVMDLIHTNPSLVFFNLSKVEKTQTELPGPLGSLGVPLTATRSVAIDPNVLPLGTPIFLNTTYPESHPKANQALQHFVFAQDTGGAIRGALRADFFWGFGAQAGEYAGKMKQTGAMWVLLPRTPQ